RATGTDYVSVSLAARKRERVMILRHGYRYAAPLVLLIFLAGCAVPSNQLKPPPAATENRAMQSLPSQPAIVQVGYQRPTTPPPPVPPSFPPPLSPHPSAELPLDRLLPDGEARTPSLQAAVAAWNAAAQLYPQQASLDDRMLEYMISPAVGREG